MYAGEKVPKFMYDPETDKERKPEAWIKQVQKEEDSYRELASVAHELISTRGWKLLAEAIQETIDKFTKSLLVENDFDKIKRIQVAIKCYESQLAWPQDRINELESFQTRTSELLGDNPQEEDNE